MTPAADRPSEPAYVNGFVDGRDVVLLYREAPGGRLMARRRRAEWSSFFETASLKEPVLRDLRNSTHVAGISVEGRWTRVKWQAPEWRRQIFGLGRGDDSHDYFKEELGIRHFEADVDPIRRFFSDTGAKVAAPRRVYLDIETDSRVPPVLARQGKARVLVWVLCDEDEREVARGVLEAETDEAEARLLEAMWEAAEPYDQFVAWYGDGFDFPVVRLRSEIVGARMKDVRRWLFIDQMVVFERNNKNSAESGDEKVSLKLQDVAMAKLGRGKNEFDASKTYEAWASGGAERERLVEYCAQDTRLLPGIERETGYLALNDAVCIVCRLFADTKSASPAYFVDGFMLRLGVEKGLHFPTRKWEAPDETRKKFKGAWVMEPSRKGIVKNVHVADFSGMYPSIIETWNMSPETKNSMLPYNGPIAPGYCRAPSTRISFALEPQGILAFAVETIGKERKVWSKRQAALPPGTPEWRYAGALSMAFKVVRNSFYGVATSPASRYCDVQIGESITQNGVWLIQMTIAAGQQRGIEAIYGDTDALNATNTTRERFAEFVDWCNRDLYPPAIAATGCRENRVEIAYEKEFERIVYCNPPEAPIWMADGSFKPLGEMKVGDRVFGWDNGPLLAVERRRRWSDRKKNGVAGPKSNGPPIGGGRKRSLCESEVLAVNRRRAPIVKVRFESGREIRCTPDHRWKVHGRAGTYSDYVPARVGMKVSFVADPPRDLSIDEQREADWLGGIWDGEGTIVKGAGDRGTIAISQSIRVNPEVCERIESALTTLGFVYSVDERPEDMRYYRLLGGLQTIVRFLKWCRPAKSPRLIARLLRDRFRVGDRVVGIVPDGEGEVVSMTTSTGNYVAWGYASKNCSAKRYVAQWRHYKWTTTCSCDVLKGGKLQPGALDVRTMTCRDCGKVHATLPPPRGEPEIKGLEYKRGDASALTRKLQWQVVQRLMVDLSEDPADFVPLVEAMRDYVLTGTLPVREVQLSKSLSKSLKEYETKIKKDGSESSDLAHVAVGKILRARGEQVVEGSRVFYYVVDASVSPMKVAPAVDYAGEFDRHYMWESLVWPATQRLLVAAFPDHDWRAYDKTRPRKPRAGGKGDGQADLWNSSSKPRAARAAPAGQGSLFELPRPAASAAHEETK